MKVIAVRKRAIDLKLVKEEFSINFTFQRKRGINTAYDHWFTATGKCKIWRGGLNLQRIGDVGAETSKELITQLKNNNTEIFQDGNRYYTTTGESDISEIENMHPILNQAREEWEVRFKE